MTRITADALYRLLPAVHRLRDADEGGPLRALIGVLAREGAVIEEDIEQLLDNLFIETCADWAAPYIGGTIGYRTLHGVEGLPVATRAEVANTIAYRRRKGTPAVLEQLARDVTGWPARVVEYFQLVATCQHMNHVRAEHFATPDLRDPLDLEPLGRAFDAVTRAVDVRSITQSPGRRGLGGRHNLPNVGLHLWRLEPFAHTAAPTTPVDARRYLFDPLGAPRQPDQPPAGGGDDHQLRAARSTCRSSREPPDARRRSRPLVRARPRLRDLPRRRACAGDARSRPATSPTTAPAGTTRRTRRPTRSPTRRSASIPSSAASPSPTRRRARCGRPSTSASPARSAAASTTAPPRWR